MNAQHAITSTQFTVPFDDMNFTDLDVRTEAGMEAEVIEFVRSAASYAVDLEFMDVDDIEGVVMIATGARRCVRGWIMDLYAIDADQAEWFMGEFDRTV